jgi:hypothetical protein
MLERLYAMLLAITGSAGCELEGDALNAYIALCAELAAGAMAEASSSN